MSSVAERVREVVAPLVDAAALRLYDLEHAGGVVRVIVEAPGATVTLEQIASLTRAVSRALDDADPISSRYTLEVSSPGLERTLRTPAHFAGAVGSDVKVKTRVEVDGARRFAGALVTADDESIVIRDADASEHRIDIAAIDRARTVFEWGPPPKPVTKQTKTAKTPKTQETKTKKPTADKKVSSSS